MMLPELLRRAVALHGDRPFLIDPPWQAPAESPVTYRAFQQGVNRLAAGLRAQSVRKGDRVGAVLPNSPDLLYLWFAVASLGAVLVPMNPLLTDAEIAQMMSHAAVTLLVGEDHRFASAFRVAELQAMASSSTIPDEAVSEEAPVTILYTSGTTGHPKGCVLTHESYVAPAQQFRRWMEVAPTDRFFGCLPLFHMAGQAFAASAVASGASFVSVKRFSASHFWDQIYQCKATIFRHLGEMLAVLCQQPEHLLEREHTLRAVYGGGARPEVAERFEDRFGVRVVEGYGLTETNTVLCNAISQARRGSIGRPLPYAAVRIANEAGEELAPGNIGEIQVKRNPVMFLGYYGAPDLTAESFCADWYRTGDLGYRDEEGYFFFSGRLKEIIRRRGENIAPLEIEEVLRRFPAVSLVAVVGVADEVGGEEAKAFVVPAHEGHFLIEPLIAWCKSELAAFKIPRYFELCTDLPRTPTNKINKGLLRSLGTLGGPCYETR